MGGGGLLYWPLSSYLLTHTSGKSRIFCGNFYQSHRKNLFSNILFPLGDFFKEHSSFCWQLSTCSWINCNMQSLRSPRHSNPRRLNFRKFGSFRHPLAMGAGADADIDVTWRAGGRVRSADAAPLSVTCFQNPDSRCQQERRPSNVSARHSENDRTCRHDTMHD